MDQELQIQSLCLQNENIDKKQLLEEICKLSQIHTGGMQRGDELYKSMEKNTKIFSIDRLDVDKKLEQLLKGIYSNQVTELTGQTGSGKTKFCFKLIDSFVKQYSSQIYYIDSGKQFDREKFFKMNGYISEQDRKSFESNVIVKSVNNAEDLMITMLNIQSKIVNSNQKVEFVIIDSFSKILVQSLSGDGNFEDYKIYMQEFEKIFFTFTQKHNVGVITTTVMKESNFLKKPQSFLTHNNNLNSSNNNINLNQQKFLRLKSVLPSPWNFIPDRTIMIEKVLTKSDMQVRQSKIKFTVLQSKSLSESYESIIINEEI